MCEFEAYNVGLFFWDSSWIARLFGVRRFGLEQFCDSSEISVGLVCSGRDCPFRLFP